MSTETPLGRAISLVGLVKLARSLNLTHQAIRKWERAGRMPRTEWTGETAYSAQIEALTGSRVTRDELLRAWGGDGPEHAATVPHPVPPAQTLSPGGGTDVGGQPPPTGDVSDSADWSPLMAGDRRERDLGRAGPDVDDVHALGLQGADRRAAA